MCGRYTLETDPRFLARDMGWETEIEGDPRHPHFQPRFNIAPTQEAAVLVRTSKNSLGIQWMKWGLIPYWAKDASNAAKLINARIETVREKPSFRDAWKSRRCLVPCSGYYEWQRQGRTSKIPWLFRLKHCNSMTFAGIWDEWMDPKTGKQIQTFSILTTQPNPLTGKVHDRMPVIIENQDSLSWLDEGNDPNHFDHWKAPYPEAQMEAFTVSQAVNRVQAEGPELIQPAPAPNQEPETSGPDPQLELNF